MYWRVSEHDAELDHRCQIHAPEGQLEDEHVLKRARRVSDQDRVFLPRPNLHDSQRLEYP
jgi:hypothetical protein